MVSQGFFSGSASAEKRRFAGERENNANFKTRVEPVKVANLYNRKIKFLKPRSGERYASALTKISHGNNIIQRYGKIDLKDYIRSFIESRNYENKKLT